MKFVPNKYTSFLQKVKHHNFNPDKCWQWMGASKGNGYGNVTVDGKQLTAHRRSHELFIGIVPDGNDVCHTCDNRNCVNPDHLYSGTRKQNMKDCVDRGRADGGCRKHLKECNIQEIKRRLSVGHSIRKIANQMDINYGTVSAIKRGDSYVR